MSFRYNWQKQKWEKICDRCNKKDVDIYNANAPGGKVFLCVDCWADFPHEIRRNEEKLSTLQVR